MYIYVEKSLCGSGSAWIFVGIFWILQRSKGQILVSGVGVGVGAALFAWSRSCLNLPYPEPPKKKWRHRNTAYKGKVSRDWGGLQTILFDLLEVFYYFCVK